MISRANIIEMVLIQWSNESNDVCTASYVFYPAIRRALSCAAVVSWNLDSAPQEHPALIVREEEKEHYYYSIQNYHRLVRRIKKDLSKKNNLSLPPIYLYYGSGESYKMRDGVSISNVAARVFL